MMPLPSRKDLPVLGYKYGSIDRAFYLWCGEVWCFEVDNSGNRERWYQFNDLDFKTESGKTIRMLLIDAVLPP